MQTIFSSNLFWLPGISLPDGITARFWPPGISFLAANPRKTPIETSLRNCLPGFPYLAAISPRNLGAFWPPRFLYLAAILARITPRFPVSHRESGRVFGRQDFSYLASISRRDLGRDLGMVPRSWRSRRDSRRDRDEIASRSRRDLGKIFTRDVIFKTSTWKQPTRTQSLLLSCLAFKVV